MTRTHSPELHAQAVELRAQGCGYTKISKLLGVAPNTVRRWTDPAAAERNRVWSREAKRRRTGTCVDCAAPTKYNGHGVAVSERCHACASAKDGGERKVWTRAAIITAIQQWAAIYSDAPSMADWWHATDRSPSFATVVREFGSWNAGLRVAGYQPRPALGTSENHRRRVVVNKGREAHRRAARARQKRCGARAA